MKFYGIIIDKNAKKHFVRKFKVVNGEIIQYMANGEIRKKPYSKKGESKLLKRMRRQVENASNMRGPNIFSYAWLGLLLLTTVSESLLVSIFGSTMLLIFGAEITSNTIKVRDLEKHRYFLGRSTGLNDERVAKDDNVLIGVSQKAKEIIKNTPNGQPIFTINSIDGMSLQDLKRIRKNIIKSYFTSLVKHDGATEEEIGIPYTR